MGHIKLFQVYGLTVTEERLVNLCWFVVGLGAGLAIGVNL